MFQFCFRNIVQNSCINMMHDTLFIIRKFFDNLVVQDLHGIIAENTET